MKKLIIMAFISLLCLGFSGQSMARVDIRVNVPPPFVFPAPPELIVIPGTYIYYSPDVDFDLFFYAGYWYRPYGGYWYRSVRYDGPWVYIARPPSVIVSLPPDYRIVTRGYRHIPYSELHRNWRAWQRDRYWEHHNWGREEHQREHGLAPSYRGGERGEDRGGIHQRDGSHGREGHEDHQRH